MSGHTTIEATLRSDQIESLARPDERWTLVLAWSRDEPQRVGEVALIDGPALLGRGAARDDDTAPRLAFVRQRPDRIEWCPPIESPRISRQQLVFTPGKDTLAVRSVGRCSLRVNGERATEAELGAGATLRLSNELVLLVSRRPPMLPPLRSYPRTLEFPFGTPDPDGLVGESPAAWRLRDELAFAARAAANVLLWGPSGAGKELAAQAVHRLSARARGPLVSRNAATFPEGIIDAELFGNVKNYPNPGTPERDGLIGRADGGTLFLDEIGELAPALQAHLLRVLDAGGEYQRLGEATVRNADLRVVAATNRDPSELKHDFAARLTMRVRIPSLDERRDDLPLLVVRLLARLAATHADVEAESTTLDAALLDELLRHDYRLQVRELEQLLWRALAESPDGALTLTPGVKELLAAPADAAPADASPAAAVTEPTRAEIEAALDRCGGSVSAAATALGLKNRFVLYRLMRKHDLPRA